MSEAEASKPGTEPARNGTTVNGAATNEWRDWPTENATAKAYGLVSAQLRRITKKHALSPLRAPDLTLRYGPHVVAQLETILKKDGIPPTDDDDDDDEPRLRTSGKKAAETELIAALRLSQEHTRQSAKLYHEGMKEALDLMKAANKDLAEECRTLRQSHREATEARELALDQRAERDLLIEQARKKDARLDAVMTTAGQGIQMAIAQIVETWQDWKKPKHVKAAELLEKLATRIGQTLDLTAEEQAELVAIVVGEEEKTQAPAAAPSSGSSSDGPQKTVVETRAEPAPSASSTSMGDEGRAPAGATAAPSSGAGTDAGTAPTAVEPPGTAAAGDRAGTAAPDRGTAGPEAKPRASRRAPSDTQPKKRK